MQGDDCTKTDDAAPEESLNISESDVRRMSRLRRLEWLFKPVTAMISAVAGFMLSSSLVAGIEGSSSSYPYAAALAAGLPSGTRRKAKEKGRSLFRLLPWLVAGLLLGAIAGHMAAETSFGTSTYYGVSPGK